MAKSNNKNKPTAAAADATVEERIEETITNVEQIINEELSRHDGFVAHADDPMLNYREAGDLVGRSRNTIRNWVEDGLLRAFRDPSGISRIRKSELTRFYGASALAEKRPLPES